MSQFIHLGKGKCEHGGRSLDVAKTYGNHVPHYAMPKYLAHQDCPVYGHQHLELDLRGFAAKIGDNQCLGIYWLCIVPEYEAKKDEPDLGKAVIYGRILGVQGAPCPGSCDYGLIGYGDPRLEDIADALTQVKKIKNLQLEELDMASARALTKIGLLEVTTVRQRVPWRRRVRISKRRPSRN